jgi:hypothetical protein
MASVTDSRAFTFFKFAFTWTDKIDRDLDTFANQSLPEEFLGFLRIECLARIRKSSGLIVRSTDFRLFRVLAHFGPRVELSCKRRSLSSLSTTDIWSPLQTRMTVASNVLAKPLVVDPVLEMAGAGIFA